MTNEEATRYLRDRFKKRTRAHRLEMHKHFYPSSAIFTYLDDTEDLVNVLVDEILRQSKELDLLKTPSSTP